MKNFIKHNRKLTSFLQTRFLTEIVKTVVLVSQMIALAKDSIDNDIRPNINSKIREKMRVNLAKKREKKAEKKQFIKEQSSEMEFDEKLGEKYLSKQLSNDFLSDEAQFEFLTKVYEKTDTNLSKEEPSGTIFCLFYNESIIHYTKAKLQCRNDAERFKTFCKIYDKKNLSSAETGQQRSNIQEKKGEEQCECTDLEKNGFTEALDYSLFVQRFGDSFLDKDGVILNSNHRGTYLTHEKQPVLAVILLFPPEENYDEDMIYSEYKKGEDWQSSSNRLSNANYIEMDINLNKIIFDEHWLSSQEDKLCTVIRSLHNAQDFWLQQSLIVIKKIDEINNARSNTENL
ncbi:unnamed protein product [Dracunculus medinensis]|uniref:Uncharacterized protein n=1 Tax=Dracunculus medinensis TaxID=318479 RepID=A0A0N4U799_DRAME|nr:unnamed protein product [Dracunculus medinensis]